MKKVKKINFKATTDTLSRDEMRELMAGSGSFGDCGFCSSSNAQWGCYKQFGGPGNGECRCMFDELSWQCNNI